MFFMIGNGVIQLGKKNHRRAVASFKGFLLNSLLVMINLIPY